jgi:hypothetical protein
MLLCVYWAEDGTENRHVRQGEVRVHAADRLPSPPLTQEEMMEIAYVAKMEFGRIMRRRRRKAKARPAVH